MSVLIVQKWKGIDERWWWINHLFQYLILPVWNLTLPPSLDFRLFHLPGNRIITHQFCYSVFKSGTGIHTRYRYVCVCTCTTLAIPHNLGEYEQIFLFHSPPSVHSMCFGQQRGLSDHEIRSHWLSLQTIHLLYPPHLKATHEPVVLQQFFNQWWYLFSIKA